jgi:hypothetical protein
MGSSAIRTIIIGTTGPTGPIGPVGPIGPTGTGTGFTGPKGKTANYVSTIIADQNLIKLVSGDKTFILYGTQGATGYTGTIFGNNYSAGLSFFSSASGYTLTLRGISFIGNLRAEITGDSILVTPIDVSYGVTLSGNQTDSTVLFSKTDSVIDSTRIKYGKTYGEFSFSNVSGITQTSSQVYANIRGNVIDVPSGSNDLILGLTTGAIYKINTPLGLSGFTLDSSLYNDNELLSVTFFVEGNGFSQFPTNVYFEDTPYSSNFGCGTNIMNLMTPNKGKSWYATIIERGYGATLCSGFDGVGSCCYSQGKTLVCSEYVTEDWCKKNNGSFNLFTACSSTCGATAICCSNGQCVSGVSESECEYFGGKYYLGIACDGIEYTSDDDNTVRQCYDSTKPVTSCCTGVTCISDVTFKVCEEYYGGIGFVGNCCDCECKDGVRVEISGACCVSETKTCQNVTPTECSKLGGIFFGKNTTCNTIDCGFDVPVTLGSCCYPDKPCVDNIDEKNCFGIFYPNSTCDVSCGKIKEKEIQETDLSKDQIVNVAINDQRYDIICGGNPDPCIEFKDDNIEAL